MLSETIERPTLANSPQMFAVYYVPYVFRGALGPHGLKYCLRVHEPNRARELLQKGCSTCFQHGIVFGDWINIEAELPEPWSEWSFGGHLPYLPAPEGISDFDDACLRPRERVFRPVRLKRTFRNEAERRIFEARARNLSRGLFHV